MRTLLLSFGMCASLCAADITGVWLGKMPTRKEDYQDLAFQFTQKGSVLTGKMYGDYQSTPISDGIVSGDSITFVLHLQEQSGNQINETRVRFTGKVTGGAIELVREREASTNAGNGGAVQMKNNAKQTCHFEAARALNPGGSCAHHVMSHCRPDFLNLGPWLWGKALFKSTPFRRSKPRARQRARKRF